MSENETLRVCIEDDPVLGPWFIPARMVGPLATSLDLDGLRWVPAEQVERWEQAEEAWREAQREMRSYLAQRDRELAALIGRVAGPEAAERADEHMGNRKRGRRGL